MRPEKYIALCKSDKNTIILTADKGNVNVEQIGKPSWVMIVIAKRKRSNPKKPIGSCQR